MQVATQLLKSLEHIETSDYNSSAAIFEDLRELERAHGLSTKRKRAIISQIRREKQLAQAEAEKAVAQQRINRFVVLSIVLVP